MTTAEALRSLRKETDKSAQQIAMEMEWKTGLKVSRESIEKWEKGTRTPNAEAIVALCKYYGVTADYLLGNSQIRQDENLHADISSVLNLSPEAISSLIQIGNPLHYAGASILDSMLTNKEFIQVLDDMAFCKNRITHLYSQIAGEKSAPQSAIEHHAMMAEAYLVRSIKHLVPVLRDVLGNSRFDELLKEGVNDAE